VKGYIIMGQAGHFMPGRGPEDDDRLSPNPVSRKRSKKVTYKGTYGQKIGTGPWVFFPQDTVFTNRESVISINHGPAMKYLGAVTNGITVANIGGPFISEKRYMSFPVTDQEGLSDLQKIDHLPSEVHVTYQPSSSIFRKYDGFAAPISPNVLSTPSLALISNLALNGYGNKARSLIDPSNPHGQISTALGELYRDGLPAISGASTWKNRLQDIRDSGHEYLNVEFGWKPLVSDIRSAVNSMQNTTRILRQIERTGNRPIRRKFRFPTITSESTSVVSTNVWPHPIGVWGNMGGLKGDVVKDTKTSVDVWFSGCFGRFVTPELSKLNRFTEFEAKANALLGTRLTPETLWNLTPWSWLVDWQIDIGAMLSILSRQLLDGSVMWYGYTMANSIKTETYSHTAGYVQPIQTVTHLKQRNMATPFGFGLSPQTDFSPKQLAILAALGITRAKWPQL
jgi:hypothetical protein